MSTADEKSALLLKRKKLNESLRRLRMDQATKLQIPAMQVFQNSTLADIVVLLPKSKAELVRINGLGPNKVAEFGDAILAAVDAYRTGCSLKKSHLVDSSPPVISPDDKEANDPTSSTCHAAADDDEIVVGPLLGAEFV